MGLYEKVRHPAAPRHPLSACPSWRVSWPRSAESCRGSSASTWGAYDCRGSPDPPRDRLRALRRSALARLAEGNQINDGILQLAADVDGTLAALDAKAGEAVPLATGDRALIVDDGATVRIIVYLTIAMPWFVFGLLDLAKAWPRLTCRCVSLGYSSWPGVLHRAPSYRLLAGR